MSPMVKEILLQLTCLLPLARLTPYTMILKLTHLNPSAPSFIAETRVSGSQAERLFRSLGYNDMHIVDAVGFSGRLWMIWNSDQVTIFLMPDGTQAIHAVCKGPWAIMGDFNNSCNMIDLAFSGPPFTWTNEREVGSFIMERIDRVWANPEWRTLFPEASVSHLPRTHSDLFPLSFFP
ncbi:Endonuclease/exonuclease/phosphatase [Corchorus olitorius]|uniref:Endonuclease/exonuclease/phosphatase n=1 Tax=Corchorus olitorius TaxID=93759 RepID=A0A1R3KVS5_9ROSI|nr:Endonuclease/exonuclease/phosphatase [Corchorus olitorius]